VQTLAKTKVYGIGFFCFNNMIEIPLMDVGIAFLLRPCPE
jgi:hypothetical protein